MADLKTLMEDIAKAIRLKTGINDKINAQDFPQKIREIGDSGNTSISLNIAYGDTAPADTSKLWIKAPEPKSVVFGSKFEGVGSIETIGNLPTAICGMGCARVGNKVYLFGGQTDNQTDTITVFNLDTQEITILETTLPTAVYDMSCVSVDSKVYLFGGYGSSYLDTINIFDTETEMITTLDVTLPIACSTIACVSIDTKIYLLGGTAEGTRNYLNTINVFDTETQTITQLSTKLPFNGRGIGSTRVGKKIYLFGYYYYSMGYAYSNAIYMFDAETQTITRLSTRLPAGGYKISCVSIGDKIYLFGGTNNSLFSTINMFDTETQSITTLNTTLPNAAHSISCINYGNKVYLFGGSIGSSNLDTINQFSVTHELTQNNIEVITAYKNFFNVVNTDTMKVEIGVNSVLIGNAENQAENCEAYLYQNDAWIQI